MLVRCSTGRLPVSGHPRTETARVLDGTDESDKSANGFALPLVVECCQQAGIGIPAPPAAPLALVRKGRRVRCDAGGSQEQKSNRGATGDGRRAAGGSDSVRTTNYTAPTRLARLERCESEI